MPEPLNVKDDFEELLQLVIISILQRTPSIIVKKAVLDNARNFSAEMTISATGDVFLKAIPKIQDVSAVNKYFEDKKTLKKGKNGNDSSKQRPTEESVGSGVAG